MKAVVINGTCKADELRVSQIEKPQVRPGWILIKVHAAGLNHSEVLLRTVEADNDYINTPIVPGIECVGEVAASVEPDFSEGQRVVALMGGMGRSFNGSYAEYALVPRRQVFHIASQLDWVSLAAVPETYFTAYGSLTQGLLLTADDRLLVRGATSTVGKAAVQLAKAMGATVVATSRKEAAFDGLRRLGVDYVLQDNGQLEGVFTGSRDLSRPNKVLELIGPRTLADSMRLMDKPGYVCQTGHLGGVYALAHFDPIKDVPNGVFLTGFFSNYPTQAVIDDLFSLIESRHLQPLHGPVFTLDEIAEAHRLLEEGTAGGKIILKISD